MLTRFFFMLREAGLKVSLSEHLALLEALQAGACGHSVDEFYFLARSALVKDEAQFDRFDRVFGTHFKGIESLFELTDKEIPADWLRREAERLLSEEEKARIEALGGFEALLKTLAERLREQQERHSGGNKWIGTGGASPFGAYGYNPEGIRMGQEGGCQRRAVKVWDRREFRNLDEDVEIGTRNLKLALRKLRRLAREGAQEELDLTATIGATARNAGLLDLRMVPERHNAVKILLFIDVGGSMDDHVPICEQLFSAARSEFKYLEYFYFHNCVYESVWRDNRRRRGERTPVAEVIHKYAADYKLIFVGDATMGPYEILYPGGSVEHWNDESGAAWMQRLLDTYPKAIWLNPEPEPRWHYTHSIRLIRELLSDRMYPLTLSGLETGIRALR